MWGQLQTMGQRRMLHTARMVTTPSAAPHFFFAACWLLMVSTVLRLSRPAHRGHQHMYVLHSGKASRHATAHLKPQPAETLPGKRFAPTNGDKEHILCTSKRRCSPQTCHCCLAQPSMQYCSAAGNLKLCHLQTAA